MEGDEPSMYSAGAEGGVDESTRPRLVSREISESVLTAGMGGPSTTNRQTLSLRTLLGLRLYVRFRTSSEKN